MNTRTRKIALCLAVLMMVGVFFWMRELASWRPQLVSVTRSGPLPMNRFRYMQWPLVKISPNARFVFVDERRMGSSTGILDLQKRTFFKNNSWARHYVIFSPDSQRAFIWNPNEFFRVGFLISTRDGKTIRKLSFQSISASNSKNFCFSSDGRELLLVGDSEIWRSNIQTRKIKGQRLWPAIAINEDMAVVFSTNQKQLMMHDTDGLHFYDVQTGQKLGFIGGQNLDNAGWSPDGKIVWAWQASAANFLKVHRGQGRSLHTFQFDSPEEIHFTPDSRFFAGATPQGLEMRDVMTGKLVKTLPGPREEPFDISSDGNFAISVDSAGKIWRWRLR